MARKSTPCAACAQHEEEWFILCDEIFGSVWMTLHEKKNTLSVNHKRKKCLPPFFCVCANLLFSLVAVQKKPTWLCLITTVLVWCIFFLKKRSLQLLDSDFRTLHRWEIWQPPPLPPPEKFETLWLSLWYCTLQGEERVLNRWESNLKDFVADYHWSASGVRGEDFTHLGKRLSGVAASNSICTAATISDNIKLHMFKISLEHFVADCCCSTHGVWGGYPA